MSWWFDTLKGTIEQAYDFLNNEETIGETLSEFAYTVQTGYPRYILNNFSVRDLERFLNHPQIDSFFVIVREDIEGNLFYGITYKSERYGWKVSTVNTFNGSYISMSLIEYLTGKPCENDYEFAKDSSRILTVEEEDIIDYSSTEPKEEKLLLLRPKSDVSKIRKLIAFYESKVEPSFEVSSEEYVFHLILNQAEYLNPDTFKFIRKLIQKSIRLDSPTDASKVCKQISVLFEESFQAYRVGLLY